ncbi:unnamed protein product [Paramecium pentaurelia]|uniref:Sperm-tail PG-rich repeat-containing protein 2 n=1 Tax=Paramecium pentaurelia TaxID=43138 RepID=A0A8S1VT90_9CILI|nr:unnamed protein product [Paramecium pentaurelia]
MAFVFQAERDLNQSTTQVPANVGPGTYTLLKTQPARQQVVPFNTQTLRCKPIKQNSLPGPGSYNINFVNAGQKVVLQSTQSDVQILEMPKQHSVFASKCRRFQEGSKNENPGPGSYEPEMIQQQRYQMATQENLVEQLMKLNKYKSIPSIPSNSQIHGYTDNGTLELNKSPEEILTGLKNDSVGPGQYDLKDLFEQNKNRGFNWHKSKQPKLAPVVSKEKQQLVGPGNYEIPEVNQPLYKLMPSGSFQSKTQRLFDMERGQKARSFMRYQFEKKRNQLISNPQFADLQDEEIEYIEDATPGPGYYYKDSTTASTYSKSATKIDTQCFGSKQKRFEDEQVSTSIGPGDYRVDVPLANKSLSYKQPPFMSSNSRFDAKLQEKRPGPQTYNPKQTLEYNLIKRLERAPVGKFGYNQPRFDDNQFQVPQPGPGSYHFTSKSPEKGAQSVFKSSTKRTGPGSQSKSELPAPGQYDPKNYTIEYKTKMEEEEDPALKIQKPPFMSSMPRFQHKDEKKIEELDEEEESLRKSPQKEPYKMPFQVKKHAPPFNIQEKRFQYENSKNQSPGPGEYHDEKRNPWDKKTYNIQFSEI